MTTSQWNRLPEGPEVGTVRCQSPVSALMQRMLPLAFHFVMHSYAVKDYLVAVYKHEGKRSEKTLQAYKEQLEELFHFSNGFTSSQSGFIFWTRMSVDRGNLCLKVTWKST